MKERLFLELFTGATSN